MVKMLLLIMVIFSGFGCAAKKMAIDNAETLITYQIGKDLPLSKPQKNELNKDVISFLNGLKPLSTKLQDVLQKFNPADLETIDSTYQELEKSYLIIAQDFSKILARSMADFNQTQQNEYLEIQKKKASKIKKNKPSERLKKSKERLEHFLGHVTEEQQNLLAGQNAYFEERALSRIERRGKLQEQFKEIFSKDITSTEKEKLIFEAFVNYQKESLAGNKNLEMLKVLLPTLKEDQIKHLNSKKNEIIDLLKYFNKKEY